MKKLFVCFLLAICGGTASSQTGISAKEASLRIGDSVTVMDKVYGGRLLSNGMTLLNLGGDFPNHLLVVMIKSEDRAKFNYKPEEVFAGKYVLVTGKLIDYKGKPEIIITDPSQIKETIPTDPEGK